MMLKNDQTCFETLAVFTPQTFQSMFGYFAILCIKGLKRQIRETVFVVLSLEDLKTFSLRLYVYDTVFHGTSKHLFQINGDILKR